MEREAQGIQRTKIWSRGVDIRRFNPHHHSQAWRLRLSYSQPETPLLLYVGRLSPEKRVDWLRPLLAALPQVRLAIVGDGPTRPELERLFANTPTVFTGYLRGHDLACAYAAADIFVFPAANETLGNVVLEAMASGLPVKPLPGFRAAAAAIYAGRLKPILCDPAEPPGSWSACCENCLSLLSGAGQLERSSAETKSGFQEQVK